jgi:hypothetical protein
MNERKKLSSFFGGSSRGTTGAAYTTRVSIRPANSGMQRSSHLLRLWTQEQLKTFEPWCFSTTW